VISRNDPETCRQMTDLMGLRSNPDRPIEPADSERAVRAAQRAALLPDWRYAIGELSAWVNDSFGSFIRLEPLFSGLTMSGFAPRPQSRSSGCHRITHHWSAARRSHPRTEPPDQGLNFSMGFSWHKPDISNLSILRMPIAPSTDLIHNAFPLNMPINLLFNPKSPSIVT
jgi:hypothetical protein